MKYLEAKNLSRGTQKEYRSTVTKWIAWDRHVDIDRIDRTHIREFLDQVYTNAVESGGTNPGRTANKAREHLKAILSWAWEQDFIEKLPRFPRPKQQRDVAGRHYLTKSDLNALYFATYQLPRPRGWKQPATVGHHRRAALVVFFSYGVDTGTVFKCAGFHEPILWRHVTWRPEPPNGQGKDSRYGWLYYRRVKMQKQFYRPMNCVVHTHLKNIRTETIDVDCGVFHAGTSRPNQQFQFLCHLAGVKPRQDVETGEERPGASRICGKPALPTTTSTCQSRRSKLLGIPSVKSRKDTTLTAIHSRSRQS
ncbi:site-specific integrase [Roseiconus lacunae]|uniref:site-specific integrase n=1 Tax=Roseiconus lacunae TaxID=2605694 RepID=UPI00135C4D7A|nr:site-specific integrase [Roseiconus lacunae]